MGFYPLHNPGAPLDLELGGLSLSAFSISGLATYVLVPAFDACFDLGHCAVEATRLRSVFLSHVHQDHIGGIQRHRSLRAMFGNRPSRFYVPAESEQRVRELLWAYEALEEKPPSDLSAVVFGVAPGGRVRLSAQFEVSAFDVVHRLPSRGYTVTESRRKLRAEYQGLPGVEIGKARERGEPLYDIRLIKRFTYVGDSTIETLRRHPELGESEVLFLEVTHLPGTDPEVTERYGHTHLDELLALYETSPETLGSAHIVLKHWSTRYARSEIEAVRDLLPEGLRARVTLLL